MSAPYEEIIEGVSVLRPRQSAQHEAICNLLHERVAAFLKPNSPARLLERRSVVQLSPGTILRPDLALVTTASNKLYLAAEIIGSDDHKWDTVTKKQIYEDARVPRLWMVDPRYNNVEVYHGTQYGIALQHILAGKEVLKEAFLPGLELTMAELFG